MREVIRSCEPFRFPEWHETLKHVNRLPSRRVKRTTNAKRRLDLCLVAVLVRTDSPALDRRDGIRRPIARFDLNRLIQQRAEERKSLNNVIVRNVQHERD